MIWPPVEATLMGVPETVTTWPAERVLPSNTMPPLEGAGKKVWLSSAMAGGAWLAAAETGVGVEKVLEPIITTLPVEPMLIGVLCIVMAEPGRMVLPSVTTPEPEGKMERVLPPVVITCEVGDAAGTETLDVKVVGLPLMLVVMTVGIK